MTAIRVENLAKCYRIGRDQSQRGYKTLRESVTDLLSAPIRHLRSGAALGHTEEFWALKDINFEVEPGEVVGIIGHNGAGKSTLLKILTGITAPTTGRVELRGRVGSLLEVGTGFHPELTGRENIYLNGSILGMKHSEVQAKFDEIVDFSGVEQFLDTPVKRYSSGMRVRLAFAVAAFLEPEILVIDEVLAVGDAAFQKKCLGAMGDVANSGRTVLFVSHNMAAVEALCTTTVLLQSGTVAMQGIVADVISFYRSQGMRRDSMGVLNPKAERTGLQVIESLTLLNSAGDPTPSLLLGEPYSFEITIKAPKNLKSPNLTISVDDDSGRRMLSHQSPLGIELVASQLNFVNCTIPACPLSPGDYSVKFALLDGTSGVEVIKDAMSFSVVDSSQHNNDRGFHTGLCFTPTEWTVTL